MMAINKQINIDDSLTLLDEQQMPSQYNPEQINLTRQNHNKHITILTLPQVELSRANLNKTFIDFKWPAKISYPT